MVETPEKWPDLGQSANTVSRLHELYHAYSIGNRKLVRQQGVAKHKKNVCDNTTCHITQRLSTDALCAIEDTSTKRLHAFYNNCFSSRTEKRDSSLSRLQRIASLSRRPWTRNVTSRVYAHSRGHDDRSMMAPRLPDITPAAQKKREDKMTKRDRIIASRSNQRIDNLMLDDAGGKIVNSQDSSSGSSYSAKPTGSGMKKPSTTALRTSVTRNARNTPRSRPSQTRPLNDASDPLIGSLRDMTLTNETTSFSLIGASDAAAKKQKPARQNRLSSEVKAMPLHHCLSESQLLQPASRSSRLTDLSRPIKRYNSDVKLAKTNANTVTKRNMSRNSSRKFAGLSRNKTAMSGNVGGMRSYSSTFALNAASQSVNRENSAKTDELEDDEDVQESHADRIFEWLIDADDAEAPPEQHIDYDDLPTQTDTALHIVYDGD